MTKKFFSRLLGAALLVAAGQASAISVDLSTDVSSGELGDTVTVTLSYDGVGNPILGGGFIIDYDSAVLDYVDDSFTYVLVDIAGQSCDLPTSQCIVLDPVVVDEAGGSIEGAAGDFTGIGLLGQPVTVATFQFTIIGGTDSMSTDIGLTAGGAGGPFACLFDPACTGLALNGATIGTPGVAAVPLPAAAWFLLAGLGSLLGFRRKS